MEPTAATPCECEQDGRCPRYGREMRGALRKICRGEGVPALLATQYRQLWLDQRGLPAEAPAADPFACRHRGGELRDAAGALKTRECEGCKGSVRLKLFPCGHSAREPEEVTLADCRGCAYRPVSAEGTRRLILRNRLCPGDVLVMTAAVYSLRKQYPGRYTIAVDTSCPALWDHNPDVVPLAEIGPGAEAVDMEYPLIHQSGQRAVHFMQGYCDFLEGALGVRLPLLSNRPLVYLSRREKSWVNQVEELTGSKEPFLVVNAGRKNDYTAKFWGTANYQRVVDALAGKVRFVQVGEAGHHHPRLRGTLDLVGKTDIRQLVRLVWHSQGVVGGVSFLQHLAAALEKPSVCVMGGREGVQWNSYPRQTLLHTVGALDCCRAGGCWKSRVVPLGDKDEKDKSLCQSPVGGAEKIPLCMEKITPEEVAHAVLKYLPDVS
jgi:ADP-heptose:LPS heptosyltransferase